MRPESIKALRIVTRVLSGIIVAFALLMFIGETINSIKRGNSSPMTLYVYIQLGIFGLGLIGLILAWKWELIGGIISFFAFTSIFFVNTSSIVPIMFIFPVIAVLFIVIGYQSKLLNKKNN